MKLTKFQCPSEPVERIGPRTFVVGFSNHADFDGTMEFVAGTGAQIVITDNVRGNKGGRGEMLANSIDAQLGIRSYSSTNHQSRAWGE